jgi:bifunctional oligoribonuclease and PAP phosphatase NrnA
MNYPESKQILAEIKKANRILINLHRGPDPDSFSCAFSMYYFLRSLGKDIDVVVTHTSELSTQLSNMEEAKIVKYIDYSNFDFSTYELFITPDSGSWQQIVDDDNVSIPEIPIIVIDHHVSNEKFGKINLIDPSAVSCAQIIYLLFKDWNFSIDNRMANLLLLGVIVDSGGFAFENDSKVMFIAGELMKLGADKMKIIRDFFKTKKIEVLRYWGEYLIRMQFDGEHKFVWSALPFEIENKYKIHGSGFSTEFGSIVDGTRFGVVMSEEEKNVLKISFRSRDPEFDVSKLAELLDGGGHKMAAGGIIKGLPFDKAVEKVLEVSRKYAKQNVVS